MRPAGALLRGPPEHRAWGSAGAAGVCACALRRPGAPGPAPRGPGGLSAARAPGQRLAEPAGRRGSADCGVLSRTCAGVQQVTVNVQHVTVDLHRCQGCCSESRVPSFLASVSQLSWSGWATSFSFCVRGAQRPSSVVGASAGALPLHHEHCCRATGDEARGRPGSCSDVDRALPGPCCCGSPGLWLFPWGR